MSLISTHAHNDYKADGGPVERASGAAGPERLLLVMTVLSLLQSERAFLFQITQSFNKSHLARCGRNGDESDELRL
jgi:hypothetical protein